MSIRKILTLEAETGMVVAEDIYNTDNQLVISADTILTERIISRLEFYMIPEIPIIINDGIQEKASDSLPDTFSDSNINRSESFMRFQMAYRECVTDLKKSLDDIATSDKPINTNELLAQANTLLEQSDNSLHLFQVIQNLRKYDDTTYVHSINVSLICNIIGQWLKFSKQDLEILTISGILHDIGKLMIPSEIITKPERLSDAEYSIIKTHTIRGYNLLKNRDIDIRIKRAALLHHERCDGSGYPYGFLAEQIDPFAKIVAIADVYDAMTSPRSYRSPICPFDVVYNFESDGLSKYDAQYILVFLEGIVQTYLNNRVLLSNQQEATIIHINKQYLSRPIVKVGDTYIDLSKRKDLSIVSILYNE